MAFGLGGYLVAVPFESLDLDDPSGEIVLKGATQEALKGLPEFGYGELNAGGAWLSAMQARPAKRQRVSPSRPSRGAAAAACRRLPARPSPDCGRRVIEGEG